MLVLVVGGWVAGRDAPVVRAPQPVAGADSALEPAPVGPRGPQAAPDPTPEAALPATSTATTLVAESEVAESEVAQAGTGRLLVVPGTRAETDQDGRVVSYRVLVEEGLTVAGAPVDGLLIADTVHAVLTAPQGWQGVDGVRFRGVDGSRADMDVVIASPDTTDQLCAPLGTGGWLSCFNGSAAVLNARRWFAGAQTYGQDVVTYRTYLVSHEVGHYLGHQHEGCPSAGLPAPVMVQQTKSLEGCLANPWPNPAG